MADGKDTKGQNFVATPRSNRGLTEGNPLETPKSGIPLPNDLPPSIDVPRNGAPSTPPGTIIISRNPTPLTPDIPFGGSGSLGGTVGAGGVNNTNTNVNVAGGGKAAANGNVVNVTINPQQPAANKDEPAELSPAAQMYRDMDSGNTKTSTGVVNKSDVIKYANEKGLEIKNETREGLMATGGSAAQMAAVSTLDKTRLGLKYVFKMLDKDGDGKLSNAEITKPSQELAALGYTTDMTADQFRDVLKPVQAEIQREAAALRRSQMANTTPDKQNDVPGMMRGVDAPKNTSTDIAAVSKSGPGPK